MHNTMALKILIKIIKQSLHERYYQLLYTKVFQMNIYWPSLIHVLQKLERKLVIFLKCLFGKQFYKMFFKMPRENFLNVKHLKTAQL